MLTEVYYIETYTSHQDGPYIEGVPSIVKASFDRLVAEFDNARCEGANHHDDSDGVVGFRLAGDADERTEFHPLFIVVHEAVEHWICQDCGAHLDKAPAVEPEPIFGTPVTDAAFYKSGESYVPAYKVWD